MGHGGRRAVGTHRSALRTARRPCPEHHCRRSNRRKPNKLPPSGRARTAPWCRRLEQTATAEFGCPSCAFRRDRWPRFFAECRLGSLTGLPSLVSCRPCGTQDAVYSSAWSVFSVFESNPGLSTGCAVNVHDREAVDWNFAARRPGFAVEQGGRGRAPSVRILL